MRSRHILSLIVILASFGALISLYLLWGHYTTGPTFCKIGGAINCDLVNRGPYGKILGFPVSGIGVLGYVFIAVLALLLQKFQRPVLCTKLLLLPALRAATTLGFLFSLYLLYLELFVILAICPFCMVSLLLITIITTLAWAVDPRTNNLTPIT